ncbi:hypothetical protein CsSME_00032815 [Camellia sinensis var. sinensis]
MHSTRNHWHQHFVSFLTTALILLHLNFIFPQIMDYASLPHFCRREGSGSSKHSQNATVNCYSLDHPFHQALYNYIKQQHSIRGPGGPIKQGSAHVGHPDLAVEEVDIAKTLEAELLHLDNRDGLHGSLGDLKINDDQK